MHKIFVAQALLPVLPDMGLIHPSPESGKAWATATASPRPKPIRVNA